MNPSCSSSIGYVNVSNYGNNNFTIKSLCVNGERNIIRGRVTDKETRSPVSNASVEIKKVDTGVLVRKLFTDSSSFYHYAVFGLSRGSYTITISHPDYETQTEVLDLNKFTPNIDGITYAQKDFQLTKITKKPVEINKACIRGMVKNTNGVIISNAKVEVKSELLSKSVLTARYSYPGSPYGDYNYSIPDLSVGRYTITVSHPDYETETRQINASSFSKIINLSKYAFVDFSLKYKSSPKIGNAVVYGQVVDQTNASRIINAKINILSSSISRSTQTVSSPYYYSFYDIPVDSYTVVISHPDYVTQTQKITPANFYISSNGYKYCRLDFKLVKKTPDSFRAKIHGMVHSSSLSYKAIGATVVLKKGNEIINKTYTVPWGSYAYYELSDIPLGDYTITITHPHFKDKTKFITKNMFNNSYKCGRDKCIFVYFSLSIK